MPSKTYLTKRVFPAIRTTTKNRPDKKTNEMLIQNAHNTVEQSKMAARLASGSSIKIETLENTWRTICTGIDETKAIQEDAHKQRLEDQKRLEVIKQEFNAKYHMPNKK